MNQDVEQPARGTSIETLRQAQPFQGAMVTAEVERAVQEVQAALIIAKRFPRDEQEAYDRIMKACRRPSLAESALYAYTKGGTEVSGPSIRLAETLALQWRNLKFGWRILTQDEDSSEVEAFAWDQEANTQNSIQFTVRHEFKAKGQLKRVSDPREVYELVANQASRRLRACILRVIPGDIQDSAIEQCEKTLKDGGGKPLSDRVRDMLAAFKNDHGVSKEMIEKRVGKNADAINETELVALRRIYVSLRDGMAKVDQFFDTATSAADLKKPPQDPAAPPAEGPDVAAPAPRQPAQDARAEPAPVGKTRPVVTERGRVLTEIAYEMKVGENIEVDELPWRVIEWTDKQVVVRAAEKGAPSQPRPNRPAPEQAEATQLELQTVIDEVMSATTAEDIEQTRTLIDKLPEKDRAAATAMLNTKAAQISGNKGPRRNRTVE